MKLDPKLPTFFFLGAGASAPYGFPCGTKLVEEICSDLEADTSFRRYLVNAIGLSVERLKSFANNFIDAKHESIDEFLAIRKDLKPYDKLIIAAKLISYESPMRLRVKADEDWLGMYLRTVLKDCRTLFDAQMALSRVSFYTLNYDRSVESILFQIAMARFGGDTNGPSEQEFVDFATGKVIHCHGSLGKFSISEQSSGRHFQPDALSKAELNAVAQNLQVWDDVSNKAHDWRRLNIFLGKAEQVCILGFGFHPEIRERFQHNIFSGKKIFCARYGMQPQQCQSVIAWLSPGFQPYEPGVRHRKIGNGYFGFPLHKCGNFMKEILV